MSGCRSAGQGHTVSLCADHALSTDCVHAALMTRRNSAADVFASLSDCCCAVCSRSFMCCTAGCFGAAAKNHSCICTAHRLSDWPVQEHVKLMIAEKSDQTHGVC